MTASTSRQQGMLLATIGVLVLSFDALLIRLANADGTDVGVWRGTLVLLSAGFICVLRRRHIRWPDTRGLWIGALVATLLYGLSSALFVLSVSHTQVANTVVILASSPLFAAAISWLLFREQTSRRTLIAILVAIVGVLCVFYSSLGQPGQLGDLLALLLAVVMAMALTLLRRMPELPRLPLVAGSGLVTALICLPFASPFSLDAASYTWLALMGLIQMPLASLLIFSSTRHLPSAEVSLFLLIETVLGPVWVWWALDEALPAPTLLGGTLIVGAIALNAILSLRQQRRTRSGRAEPVGIE
ncbi:DMT family transporter [Marinobacterium sp. D7]|uniref:DMT family transporter n=1 Tax=Marinobacterium ramblicola TaxID=2849041 RepID=UPI001C2D2941|nr:DMT family transporter [Marinobacterium ramblicola]MBV1789222.1 DMT family transporter [Marinobacterium ramblicola]